MLFHQRSLLLVGLQGSGKTTSAAKLKFLEKKYNKKVLLVSLDIYRPAAQEQLKVLLTSVEPCWASPGAKGQ